MAGYSLLWIYQKNKPEGVRFDKFPIWVQLHNLPLGFWHPNILRRIGRFINGDDEKSEEIYIDSTTAIG
ncbi:hypothetical protein G4B88_022047 [Cannabis sativa]|uniref:DUF4283 domain-containing protein n=1 Tax=Cannabis sativa TaxID=3483 RepID=A0A7J6FU43_CANSA|nr:hypothetical protein G4B88_022047 [Cannabis sativa]